MARSIPSLTMSVRRSVRSSDTVTSGCASRKAGSSGATCARPNPAGAVTRRWPLALMPPSETEASAFWKSFRIRWQSSRKALPSKVRVIRRVVRTSSFTPRRSSSASMRRPITAGATPSACAAADRLPRVATATKVSSCLKRSMPRLSPLARGRRAHYTRCARLHPRTFETDEGFAAGAACPLGLATPVPAARLRGGRARRRIRRVARDREQRLVPGGAGVRCGRLALGGQSGRLRALPRAGGAGPMKPLIAFYRGAGRDHRGRTLDEILRHDDDWLERTHDFVQWLFPLREPSGANPFAPLVDDEIRDAFDADAALRASLLASLD